MADCAQLSSLCVDARSSCTSQSWLWARDPADFGFIVIHDTRPVALYVFDIFGIGHEMPPMYMPMLPIVAGLDNSLSLHGV